MTSVATPYGSLITSIHSKNVQGSIVQALNAHRGVLTAGLARRALGTTEVEITAGAAAGATITLVAKADYIPGDWFRLTHADHGQIGFWFKGVPVAAVGALEVPAKANITNADWVIFTSPTGVVTVVWFDTTAIEVVPAAVTALVAAGATGSAALEAAIDGATTAAQVMAIVETALNTAAIGVTSNDAAADGTTILTVTAAGAAGNDWDVTVVGAHADWDSTNPTGGTDDIEPTQNMLNESDYMVPVDITGATDAESVEALVITAINGAENYLIATLGNPTIDLNLPTAANGGTGVVAMLTGVISNQKVWTVAEFVTSGSFAVVQASTLDVKVNNVSISGGPFLYTTDDPGTVVVAIAAINAQKASHNYHAYEGTNSSHLGLRQRHGGAITGVLAVSVTATAAVEGGGAVSDFSGDTNTLTEIVNEAAANLPTGSWEITADLTKLDDYQTALITMGTFTCDVAIVIQRGQRAAAAAGKTKALNVAFSLPCVGLGKLDDQGRLISLGVWTVAANAVLGYELPHI